MKLINDLYLNFFLFFPFYNNSEIEMLEATVSSYCNTMCLWN